jgi:catechol 2,3-dioxygenase-like lactoylglutathione lyase family enzyme
MASNSQRLLFVDVLRLIALLQMVNGHTLHAVLDSSVRHGARYQSYLYFRGLVSVAFMLAAGFAFYLTTLLRPAAQCGEARRKRVLRALEIIAIGFLLRVPMAALLRADLSALRAALPQVLRIDVLPCIGVTLLGLELLTWLCRDRRVLAVMCTLLTIALAWLPGWSAQLPTVLPLGLVSTWLGPQGGSAFPLVPYAGFVLAGVSAASFALPLGAATPAGLVARRLAMLGAGLCLVAWLLTQAPAALLPPVLEGVHTPSFFAQKLGHVLLGCAALALGMRKVRALPRLLSVLAGETLGIYVFHLFVLYGAPLALAQRVGPNLGLPAALSVSAALVGASIAFGLGFRALKAYPLAQRTWPAARSAGIVLASVWAVSLFSPAVVLGAASGASVRSISLTVADLGDAERFFREALGFRRLGQTELRAGPEYERAVGLPGARAQALLLGLGREQIELVQFAAPEGRPAPRDSRSNDLWFQHLALVTSDVAASHSRVLAQGARAISSAPQTIPASNIAAAGIRAFYFLGPAAHPLELISYPRDKGQPRWHELANTPALGIDHTAIAVASTKKSVAFYSKLLGLRVRGHSFNSGVEQAALSGVPDARVRITGLRGAEGPGVELLEYEAPRDGRPAPHDTRASDLWHSEIVVQVPAPARLVPQLRAAGVRIVSSAPSAVVTVLDPDGHTVRLIP